VDSVGAGHRTAVNLAGLEVDEVERGDVVARPGTLRPTRLLDAELVLLAGEKPLRDNTRVRVHVASAEVLARVRVPGGGPVKPGLPGLVQLRLERPVAAGRGDRLIIRSYSPAATVGGARVLDALPPPRRRAAEGALAQLAAARSPVEVAVRMITEAQATGIDAPTLAARLTLSPADLPAELWRSEEVVVLGKDPPSFLSRTAMEALSGTTLDLLDRFHKENPLRAAIAREELRRRLFAQSPPAAFEQVLATLAAKGAVRLLPDAVALARHSITLSPGEEEGRAALLEAARAAGLAGLEVPALASRLGKDPRLLDRVARVLLAERVLERVGEGGLVHREHLESLKVEVRRRWPPGSPLDVGGFKELTGLSRKFVIPLLEYLDRERVTRRSGSNRVVLM
jgi:selenocysteine-specific elongation factor